MTTREEKMVSFPLQETDPDAQRHIDRVQAEHDKQYFALRRRAQGLFAALKGQTGIRTPEELDGMFEKAARKFDTGSFLVERLGTSRFLDPELTCVLIRLRMELLSGIKNPTAGDMMHVDIAVLSYRNCLRIQNLINNSLMESERHLFGQLSLSEIIGRTEAIEVARILGEVEQKLLPVLDRCQRMMNRALDRLSERRTRNAPTNVSIGIVEQVTLGKSQLSDWSEDERMGRIASNQEKL